MEVPEPAVELAKAFEGFASRPYVCPAGFWTIGYGHLCDRNHPTITRGTAEFMLRKDLRQSMNSVIRLCPNIVFESDARMAALIDFTFNLGAGRLASSTLRKRVLEDDWESAAMEIKRWVFGGGKKLPGLVRRRAMESELLFAQKHPSYMKGMNNSYLI